MYSSFQSSPLSFLRISISIISRITVVPFDCFDIKLIYWVINYVILKCNDFSDFPYPPMLLYLVKVCMVILSLLPHLTYAVLYIYMQVRFWTWYIFGVLFALGHCLVFWFPKGSFVFPYNSFLKKIFWLVYSFL